MIKSKSNINENCSAGPVDDNNIFLWNAKIFGPKDTPFEGGVFELQIFFPDEFPMVPPIVKCLTKIFHPNFNDLGQVCISILSTDWAPSLTISKILLSISSLLASPNPFDHLNPCAANLYLFNRDEYTKTVRFYTDNYATIT